MLQPKHLNISGLPCSVVAGDGQLGPLCDSTATVMRDVEAHRAEISKLRCGKLDRIRKYRGLSGGSVCTLLLSSLVFPSSLDLLRVPVLGISVWDRYSFSDKFTLYI